jgi:pimeloyl-ACP methyl ester carboxylesterase
MAEDDRRAESMNFRKYGAGPCRYVVVHGGPGAPGSASSLARKLSETCAVLEPFQTDTSVWGQVDELYRQIRENCTDRVFVLGHSWGAWLVYLLAYKHPQMVRIAFLVGAGPFDASYLPELQRRRLGALSIEEQAEYQEMIELLKKPSENSDRHLDRLGQLAEKADNYCVEMTDENQENMVSIDGKQFQQVMTEAFRLRKEGFFREIAGEIRCPIRIIHGNDDTTPIEGVVEPLRGAVADLKWYAIDRCGHSPWKEKYGKEEFYRIVDREVKQAEGLKSCRGGKCSHGNRESAAQNRQQTCLTPGEIHIMALSIQRINPLYFLITAVAIFTIHCGSLALAGAVPDENYLRLCRYAFNFIIATWAFNKIKNENLTIPFELSAFLFFVWPLILPYYLFKTDRFIGILMYLGILVMLTIPAILKLFIEILIFS